MIKESVILINADYRPLGLISWQKAIKLIAKGKVDIVKYSDIVIYNFEKTIKIILPKIIKLIKYVRMLYGKKVPFNKHNLLIRDNYTCIYCGCRLTKDTATIEHIKPKSTGGLSTFDNTGVACFPCNNKKDNKTCQQANMYPKIKPYTPTISEFILIHIKNTGLEKTLKELGII